jgi:anaerobic selenocysteine-containing dehydrogenase
LAKEYPYILITGGKIPMFFHSEFRQVARLRDTHPDPLVQIHPDVADKLGIAEGDWVWIETRRGRCKQRAEVFDGMDPRIIHVEHHWWFPEKPQGRPGFSGAFESNCNMLTSCQERFLDPGMGGYNLRGLLCRVYKESMPVWISARLRIWFALMSL